MSHGLDYSTALPVPTFRVKILLVFFIYCNIFLVSDEIRLPSFEWISQNLESPTLKINFPDGGNPDVVNLKREDEGPHDGHQDHEDDSCNYSGYLQQEPGDYLKKAQSY